MAPPALPPSIAAALPPTLPVRSATLLTSLWSNYGHIHRLTLSRAPHTLILKLIQPPPTSTESSESHLRKLISYRVERYFYAHLAAQLPSRARVARAYPVADAAAETALLLEDLAPAFALSSSSSSGGDPHVVLRWLANFHATFWGASPAVVRVSHSSSSSSSSSNTAGVWANGGYWYLATRRDEFAARSDPRFAFLRGAFATYAARRVAHRGGPGTTVVHGDCKGANIAWARDSGGGGGCALYDFQYVGRGLGVQDVVYFLATSVASARLQEGEGGEGGEGGLGSGEGGMGSGEEALWGVYYAELEAALERRGLRVADEGYTWAVMLEQADCALVDWMRFMVGWGCWGNAQWVEGRARAICRRWGEEGKGEEEKEGEGEGEGESE